MGKSGTESLQIWGYYPNILMRKAWVLGLMGSYVSLREGEGLIQRTWNSVSALLLPAPKHMQGFRVPSSCPGHKQQQTRQDARTKEAGLEFGQP